MALIEKQDNKNDSWGIQGSAIKGLKGLKYDPKRTSTFVESIPDFHLTDYATYENRYRKFFNEHPEYDIENTYLNSKIIDKYGNDIYKSQYSGLDKYAKLDKFIASMKEDEVSHETADTNHLYGQYIRDNKERILAEKDDTSDNWFQGFDIEKNPMETLRENIQKRLNKEEEIPSFTKDELVNIVGNRDYLGKYQREAIPEDADKKQRKQIEKANRKLDKEQWDDYVEDFNAYANDIYKKALNNPDVLSKHLEVFDALASLVDPYYRESLKYGTVSVNSDGSSYSHNFVRPFVDDKDKLKILSEYLSVQGLTNNTEKAIDHLSGRLQELRRDKYSFNEQALHATRGAGSYIAGSTAELAGFLAYGTVGNHFADLTGERGRSGNAGWNNGWIKITKEDAPDSSWWQRLYYNASNNPLTNWGRNAINTGEWNSIRQQEMLKAGVSSTDVAGARGWTLATQMGFTMGSIVATMGAGAILDAAATGTVNLANVSSRMIAGKALSKATQQSIKNIAGKVGYATMYIPLTTYTEAVQDGLETFDNSIQNGKKGLEEAARKEMQKRANFDAETGYIYDDELRDYVFKTCPSYVKLYNILNGQESIEFNPENPKSKEQIDKEFRDLQERAERELTNSLDSFYQSNYQTKLDSKETEQRLYSTAVRNFARNTITEQLVIGTSDLVFGGVLGAPHQLIKKKYGLTKSGLINFSNGKASVADYDYIRKGLGDTFGQGYEEYAQNLSQSTAEALAQADITNYFYNNISSEANDYNGYGIFSNWGAFFGALGEAAASKEAWEAALMGAAGGFIGAPSFAVNSNAARARRVLADSRYTGAEKAAAVIGSFYSNPIINRALERREHLIAANKSVEEFNDMLEADPEFKRAIEDSNGLISWASKFMKAREEDDAVNMEESEFGLMVKGINMLTKLQGTKAAKGIKKAIDDFANAKADDPSVIDFLENQIRPTLNNEGRAMSDEDLLNIIKGRVNDFNKLYKDVQAMTDEIDKTYSNNIDDSTKEAIVYSYLAESNRKKMLEEREKIIEQAIADNENLKNSTTPASPLTLEQKQAIARRGSLERARQALRDDNKKNPKKERTLTKSEKKRLLDDIALLKEIDKDTSTVLNVNDILGLDAETRALMLTRPDTKDVYSKEQQKVLLEEWKDMGFSPAVETAIKESGKIKERIRLNEEILKDLKASGDNINILHNQVFTASNWVNVNKKVEKVKEAKTYEEFKKELDKVIQGNRLNPLEQTMLEDALGAEGTKDFYKKYRKESENINGKKLLAQNINRKDTGVEANAIRTILKEAIDRDNGKSEYYSYNDIVDLLTKDEVKTALKTQGLDLDAMDTVAKNDLMSQLAKWVPILNNALANRAAQLAEFAKNHSKDSRSTQEQDDTVFNKEVYNKNKPYYDALFVRFIDAWRNPKSQKFSPQDLYAIASLISKQPLAPIDADIPVLKGKEIELNNAQLNYLYKQLIKSIDIYGDQAEFAALNQMLSGLTTISQYQTLLGIDSLSRAIAELALEINPNLKEKVDAVVKEEKEKKTKGVKWNTAAKNYKLNVLMSGDLRLTDEQKKWYDEHHISDNIDEILAGIQDGSFKPNKMQVVTIVDPSTIDPSVEYNSDNMPLVAAVKLTQAQGKQFKNAVKIGDSYYLYVGQVGNSRINATDSLNFMNDVRDAVLSGFMGVSEPTVITDNTKDHNEVIFSGFDIKRSTPAVPNLTDKQSLVDYVKQTYNLEGEDAVKFIVEHSARAKFSRVQKGNDTILQCIVPAVKNKQINGVKLNEPIELGVTEASDKKSEWDGMVFIDPKSTPEAPILAQIFVDRIDAVQYDGLSISEFLNSRDLLDEELQDSSAFWMHSIVKNVKHKLKDAAKALRKTSILEINSGGKALQNSLNKAFEAHLNLAETSTSGKNVYFKVGDATKEKSADGKETKFYKYPVKLMIGDSAVASFDVTVGMSEKQLNTVAQDIFKSVLLDENGNFRVDSDTGEALIKYQVGYSNFNTPYKLTEDVKDAAFIPMKKIRQAVNSGMLYLNPAYLQKPEVVSVSSTAAIPTKEPVNPPTKSPVPTAASTKDVQQKVIDVLQKYKVAGPNPLHMEGFIPVTVFIRGKESTPVTQEEILGEDAAAEVSTKVDSVNPATSFGTSIDSLVRLYYSPEGNRNPDKVMEIIAQETLKQDYWKAKQRFIMPGFTAKMCKEFLNNLNNLNKFFEARGEVVVPFDTQFLCQVESKGRKVSLNALPDLLTVDRNGDIHVYDMKSYRVKSSKRLSIKPKGTTKTGFYSANPLGMNIASGFIETRLQDDEYRKQISVYKEIIERMTGLRVATIGVIPIPVNYDSFAVKGYVADNNKNPFSKANDISHKDGKAYTFNSAPYIYDNVIEMVPIPVSEMESDYWEEGEAPIDNISTGIPQAPAPPAHVSMGSMDSSDLKEKMIKRALKKHNVAEFSQLPVEVQNKLNRC